MPLGSEAVVARLSGDEFAVASRCRPTSVRIAQALAEAALRGVTRPFTIDERVMQVGAFAGIASGAGGGSAHALSPSPRRHRPRPAPNGRVARPVWFDEGMERALIAQGEIEQGIRFGLEHGQFIPYFEPQVDLATGEIVGFEVLARWNHPLSGIVGADVFIPVAEEIGLIGRLSEQVIAEALGQAASWDPRVRIAVNISPSQLADRWLAQRIVRILAETGFPADRLVVEITESSLFADLDLARSIVTSLKNQGMHLALDDFGTGFSACRSALVAVRHDQDRPQLRHQHRDKEKCGDRPRRDDACQRPVGAGLRRGDRERGRPSRGRRARLRIGQGWYFGKPMPAEAGARAARRRSPRRTPFRRRRRRLNFTNCSTVCPGLGQPEPIAACGV